MRTMHLFAGAGGGLLADLILGHQPVCAVEWEPSACRILRERAAEGWFPGLHIHEGDVREFDFSPWARRVDCLSAGFPCQDISSAGRGAGITGARSGLVSEVFRAIDAIQPPFVFLENSPNIRTKGRHIVIAELVARGYSWRDGILAASDVGAGHERKRWWLLAANADGLRKLEQERREQTQRGRDCHCVEAAANVACEQRQTVRELWQGEPDLAGGFENASDAMCCGCKAGCCGESGVLEWSAGQATAERACHAAGAEAAPHSLCGGLEWLGREGIDGAMEETPSDCAEAFASDLLHQRLQVAIQRGGLSEADAETIQAVARYTGTYDWAPPDTGVCRVVDGLATRVDRIKCAGNGQVPIQAATAWLILSS